MENKLTLLVFNQHFKDATGCNTYDLDLSEHIKNFTIPAYILHAKDNEFIP